ncbi:SPTB2 protein, partial [Picathartes gymnocephalus]|nr:SPTB2 protein [Picathartes gymnocephalus]
EPVQRLEPKFPEKIASSPPASPLPDAPPGVEESWGKPSSKTPHGADSPKEAATCDPAETSTLLLPPRGPCGLGGTVNLILSIGKKGERKKAQPLASREEALPARWGSPLSPSLFPQVRVEARKTCTAKRPPAVVHRPPASSGGMPAVSHTLPKAGAGCLFNSLQRREQARAEQARLLTLQGIMGDSSLQPTPGECHGPRNTWPQKCGRRKGGPGAAAAGPQPGELLLYVRNPLVRDIDAECGTAPQNPCLPNPKITCPRLSLGSVLSLELPRDTVVLGCHRGAVARQQEAEGQEQRQDRGVRPWKPTGTHGVEWQEDGHSPQGLSKRFGMSPESEQGTWFEEVSFNPSYSQQRAHCAGKEHWNLQRPSSTSEDLLDLRPSRPSRVAMGDELATRFGQDDSPSATGRARHHKAAWLELGSSPASIRGRAGALPSPTSTQQPAGSSQPRESPASPATPTQPSVFEWALGSPQPQSPALGTKEVCHPAHRQFEEEEEELQAIWDGARERQAQSPPGGSCASHRPGSGAGSLPSPSTTAAGPLILSSANNVLVAKFTLPTTAQLLHSPSGQKSPGVVHSGSGSPNGLRVSPHVEELVSAAPLEASGAWDQRRHGQEERESSKVLPGKMEFQMMEGTLERKHVLQTGGRKASCRAWGLFHAVLMRQTLCFYQDRRDSLKSSVVALPLNLSGAVCTPDAEYTKKTNCFRLQLQDGSEYLLRAPTQPLMNEWVSKLQQNSGFPEVDYFQAAAQRVEGSSGTGSFSKVSSPGSSHLQGHHEVTTTNSQEIVVLPCTSTLLQRPLGSQDGPVDGSVAAAGDFPVWLENAQGPGHKEQQWSPRGSPGLWDNLCPEDDYGLVANKRRSYSFTSATYQKITPLAMPKEPVEAGSSYSVTLYIGEQVSAVPRARCHSFVARTGSPRDTRGDKTTSPPRTKNKSVFKKFFGKRE